MCSTCSPRRIISLLEQTLTRLENPTDLNLKEINSILEQSQVVVVWWGGRKVRQDNNYIALNELAEKINQCIPKYLNSNDYLLPNLEEKKQQWAQICRRVSIMYSESDNAIKERNYITQFLAFIHDILSSIRSVYEKNTQEIRNFYMAELNRRSHNDNASATPEQSQSVNPFIFLRNNWSSQNARPIMPVNSPTTSSSESNGNYRHLLGRSLMDDDVPDANPIPANPPTASSSESDGDYSRLLVSSIREDYQPSFSQTVVIPSSRSHNPNDKFGLVLSKNSNQAERVKLPPKRN